MSSLVAQVASALWRGVTDSRVPLSRRAELVSGFTASGVRLALGTVVGKVGTRPKQPLMLFEFDACPHSRRVREALTMLDLDADIRPCPRGGNRFAAELEAQSGKRQVPFLVDLNTQRSLGDSAAIVDYLYATYGVGPAPAALRSKVLQGVNQAISRLNSDGLQAKPSTAPKQPLELYGFESSPFTRFVRRTLSELEIPHRSITVGKRSSKRPDFKERFGKLQFPLLVDPNTSTTMFESSDIEKYLRATYGTATPSRS